MPDHAVAVDHRDRTDARKPRVSRGQDRRPVLLARQRTADSPAMNRDLPQRGVAPGERLTHVFRQDQREIRRTSLGGAERLGPRRPEVRRLKPAHDDQHPDCQCPDNRLSHAPLRSITA